MMYGFGNCAGIPAINGYQEAKAHFEKVNPIRGRANTVKPLGRNRRYTWYLITESIIANQAENSEYKTYACELYGTRCVEYYPNGDIVLRNGGWQTPTSYAFIGYSIRDIGRMISVSGKWYFINNHNEHILFKNELHLVKGEDGDYRAKTQTQEFRHSVNRKAMNAIRKKYKPFLEYARNALLISNFYDRIEVAEASHGLLIDTDLTYGRYTRDEAKARVEANRNAVFSSIEKSIAGNDLGLQYELLTLLACKAGRYSYKHEKYLCDGKEFDNYFTHLLKTHHKDEVFGIEEVPVGKAFFDRNAVYFK
jgi:hypothetical protein